jgi:hypothetical protein
VAASARDREREREERERGLFDLLRAVTSLVAWPPDSRSKIK